MNMLCYYAILVLNIILFKILVGVTVDDFDFISFNWIFRVRHQSSLESLVMKPEGKDSLNSFMY